MTPPTKGGKMGEGGWTQKLEQNKFQKDLQSVRVGAFSRFR